MPLLLFFDPCIVLLNKYMEKVLYGKHITMHYPPMCGSFCYEFKGSLSVMFNIARF